MKCPFCATLDSKVVDSRPANDGTSIRRRREMPQMPQSVYHLRNHRSSPHDRNQKERHSSGI